MRSAVVVLVAGVLVLGLLITVATVNTWPGWAWFPLLAATVGWLVYLSTTSLGKRSSS